VSALATASAYHLRRLTWQFSVLPGDFNPARDVVAATADRAREIFAHLAFCLRECGASAAQ